MTFGRGLGDFLREPARAFVDLCHEVFTDARAFQAATGRSTRSPDYLKARNGVLKALRTGVHLYDASWMDSPTAILSALDEHLWEEAGSSAPQVPTLRKASGTDAGYWLIRRHRSLDDEVGHARQQGSLATYVRHHTVCPAMISGVKIEFKAADSSLDRKLGDLPGGELLVYLGSFPDHVGPDWASDPANPGGSFTTRLLDTPTRRASLLASLGEARTLGAQVVIFPELTLCPDLVVEAGDWLKREDHPFLLALPGSFHIPENGNRYNRAALVDAMGEELLAHRKFKRFGKSKGEYELVDLGDTLRILPTVLGTLGVAICNDFCYENTPCSEIWQRISPEWLFVPAMGDEKSVSAHRDQAKKVVRAHQARVFVANQDHDGADLNHGLVRTVDSEEIVTREKRIFRIR